MSIVISKRRVFLGLIVWLSVSCSVGETSSILSHESATNGVPCNWGPKRFFTQLTELSDYLNGVSTVDGAFEKFNAFPKGQSPQSLEEVFGETPLDTVFWTTGLFAVENDHALRACYSMRNDSQGILDLSEAYARSHTDTAILTSLALACHFVADKLSEIEKKNGNLDPYSTGRKGWETGNKLEANKQNKTTLFDLIRGARDKVNAVATALDVNSTRLGADFFQSLREAYQTLNGPRDDLSNLSAFVDWIQSRTWTPGEIREVLRTEPSFLNLPPEWISTSEALDALIVEYAKSRLTMSRFARFIGLRYVPTYAPQFLRLKEALSQADLSLLNQELMDAETHILALEQWMISLPGYESLLRLPSVPSRIKQFGDRIRGGKSFLFPESR